MRLCLGLAIALAAVAALAGSAAGAVTGVLYASDLSTGRWLQVAPVNGAILQSFPCRGDATRSGPPHEILVRVPNGPVLSLASGSGMVNADFYVWEEAALAAASDCRAGDLVFSDASWARDGVHVAYALNLGTSTAQQYDIFVGNVDTGITTNVTQSARTELAPAFSPVSDTIAFQRLDGRRTEVYLQDVLLSHPTVGMPRQLTSKSNANFVQIGYPAWSPDGTTIAFHGYPSSGFAPAELYRVRADGKEKAVNITAASSVNFGPPAWRA